MRLTTPMDVERISQALAKGACPNVRQLSAVTLHGVVGKIVQRSREVLETELQNLLDRADGDRGAGSGVLRHAAEFLVSQRGINR